MLLRVYGHDVRAAQDAPSAIEIAVAFRPEVVFLDLGLPGIDGYELARRLREHPDLRQARLAALSGYGQEASEPHQGRRFWRPSRQARQLRGSYPDACLVRDG